MDQLGTKTTLKIRPYKLLKSHKGGQIIKAAMCIRAVIDYS